MLLALLVMSIPFSAEANLCRGNYLKSEHHTEAIELELAQINAGSNCADGSKTCYAGVRSFNEMILGCNRQRDFTVINGELVSNGAILDGRTVGQRNYPDNLTARPITGEFSYLGSFLKRYGYMLERQNGTWIITSILDFQFPNAEKDKLHIPLDLTKLLSETQRGQPLSETVCQTNAVDNNSNGIVTDKDGKDRACRVDRNSQLFLRAAGLHLPLNTATRLPDIHKGKQEWTPLPVELGQNGSRPVAEWLMLYWRGYIEHYWSRPNGSFRMKVEIANLAGRAGEISEAQLDSYKHMGVVYPVELHHHEQRTNNMYRPVEVLGIKVYKAIYAGEEYKNFLHEFGHSLGLGDDYWTSKKPPTRRDCMVLSGYRDLSTNPDSWHTQKRYIMCYGGAEAQHVKSVYLWIVTQRYPVEAVASVPQPRLFCLNGQCPNGYYCKNPGNRCEAKKGVGERCSKDDACASPTVCAGKPRGRCVIESAKAVDETCFKNGECASGRCTNSVCVCTSNTDCTAKYGVDFACSTNKLKINMCVQTCNVDTDCTGTKKCKKPVGASFRRCK
ncbi:MAG: hypothetical protein COW19_09775 [Zetaproteobacteria bacterium CG12_big_fil_rev_8_21_14_0_65_55_1124]|nr:MAG: hypothetical protein COW19_09775 [Zetaproteobacteria bacterium CG12_big_fil_rev_8_21_14_0_65_55_1124]